MDGFFYILNIGSIPASSERPGDFSNGWLLPPYLDVTKCWPFYVIDREIV